MTNCRKVAENLLAFRDGELPAKEVAFLRRHLHECPDCLTLLRTYEEVVDVLQRLRPVKVPDGLLERLKRRMKGP